MKVFNLFLATPERKVFEKDVVGVTLPVSDGEVTILADHIPYIASLKPGEMVIAFEGGEKEYVALSGGFVEFSKNKLTLLANTAEKADEIDEKRVQEAIKRAQKARERKDLDETEYATLVAKLEKEFSRLRVLRRK
jgi:F-type H+-transporting ATPase subunit epsilon